MNDKIVEQIVPMLEKSKEGIIKAMELAQEQFPQLIGEIVRWNLVFHLVWFAVGLAAIIPLVLCFKKAMRTLRQELKKDEEEGDHSWDVIPGVELGLGIAGAFAFFLVSIPNIIAHLVWVKILVARRLFLIEYFANLLK